MEVCYWAFLFMPLVILHHLLNVFVQLANKRGFKQKKKSTLNVCPYLTGNTLHLRCEPNRLMLSVGLWRWYINITITILDIIHRPVFYLQLNSIQLNSIGLSVPRSKHITSPLPAQQVIAVYRFVTNSPKGHYLQYLQTVASNSWQRTTITLAVSLVDTDRYSSA
jgi:hypothetical protein